MTCEFERVHETEKRISDISGNRCLIEIFLMRHRWFLLGGAGRVGPPRPQLSSIDVRWPLGQFKPTPPVKVLPNISTSHHMASDKPTRAIINSRHIYKVEVRLLHCGLRLICAI